MIILPIINYFQDQWMTYSTHNFLPNRTHLNLWQKPRKWNYQIWMTPSSTFCDFYRSSSCSKQRTFIIIKTRGQESGTWSLARCQQGQWEWKSICVLKSNIHVSFDLMKTCLKELSLQSGSFLLLCFDFLCVRCSFKYLSVSLILLKLVLKSVVSRLWNVSELRS